MDSDPDGLMYVVVPGGRFCVTLNSLMNSSNLDARLSARGVLQLQEGWWILKSPTMTWSVVTLCDTLLAVVDVCDKMEMRSSSKELVIGGIGLVVDVITWV